MAAALLGDTGQLIGVLLILAGAVGYLTIYYQRKFKGKSDGSCGCGDCGIPLRRAQERDARRVGGTQQFVPAESLSDLAARRRVEQTSRDADGHADAAESPEIAREGTTDRADNHAR